MGRSLYDLVGRDVETLEDGSLDAADAVVGMDEEAVVGGGFEADIVMSARSWLHSYQT